MFIRKHCVSISWSRSRPVAFEINFQGSWRQADLKGLSVSKDSPFMIKAQFSQRRVRKLAVLADGSLWGGLELWDVCTWAVPNACCSLQAEARLCEAGEDSAAGRGRVQVLLHRARAALQQGLLCHQDYPSHRGLPLPPCWWVNRNPAQEELSKTVNRLWLDSVIPLGKY